MRTVTSIIPGVLAGGVVGAVVPLAGDLLGSYLEIATGLTFRSWELVLLGVWFLAIPGGALAGLLGAWLRKWTAGLALGAALHATAFGALVANSDSLQAAPPAVRYWVLAVGISAGAIAGALGGRIAQLRTRLQQRTPAIRLLEPVMIVVLGAIIGMIVISLFLPMFKLLGLL
jgi:hypothetical protein